MVIKKFAESPVEQPPKSWLAEKWSDLDLWWFLNKPAWVVRAGRFYWNHIRCIVIPQNRWATRVVPRTWSDKTGLIPELLYAAIIDFVEVEKCFEVTDWDCSETTRRLAAELREVYSWAKTGRAEFDKRVQSVITFTSASPSAPFGLDGDWDEYNRLTDELEQWDTRCLTWIVVNRGVLWV